MGIKKKVSIALLFVVAIPLLLLFFSNYSIKINAKNKTFTDVSKIPTNKVGLVLGTSKLLSNGSINLYFNYRIDATVTLYESGKIEFVLKSNLSC